jgi:hypothetical protein
MMRAIEFHAWSTELIQAAASEGRLSRSLEYFRRGLEGAPKPTDTQSLLDWLSSSTSMELRIRDLQLTSAYQASAGTVMGSMDVWALVQNQDGSIDLRDPDDPSIIVYRVSASIEQLFLASIFVIEDDLFFGTRPPNSEKPGRIGWLPRSVRVRRVAHCLGGAEYIEFANDWLHSG